MSNNSNEISEILLSDDGHQKKLKEIDKLLNTNRLLLFFKEFKILWKSFSYDAWLENILEGINDSDPIIRFRVLEEFANTIGLSELISPWPNSDDERKQASQKLQDKIRVCISNRKALFFAGASSLFAFIAIFFTFLTVILTIVKWACYTI